ASTVNIALELRDPDGGDILPGVQDLPGALAAGGVEPDQVGSVVLGVRNGNPALRNTRSLNLDMSFEWYPERGTSVSLGLFYKYLKNFIFLGAESSDSTLDTRFVEELMSPQ